MYWFNINKFQIFLSLSFVNWAWFEWSSFDILIGTWRTWKISFDNIILKNYHQNLILATRTTQFLRITLLMFLINIHPKRQINLGVITNHLYPGLWGTPVTAETLKNLNGYLKTNGWVVIFIKMFWEVVEWIYI